MRRVGKRSSVPEKMKSSIDPIAFEKVSVDDTMNGASPDVAGMRDDEPMCMHTTVSVSTQAWKNGSQKPEWMLGSPRWGGISEKQTAWLPLAALRRTSAAARSASHSGTMIRGTRWPSDSPHHS